MDVIPLKFKKFEIKKPRWHRPDKTTTNNKEWRKGLFMIFEDYKGNLYDYLPKDVEILNLNVLKDEIEEINKRLCREVYQNEQRK